MKVEAAGAAYSRHNAPVEGVHSKRRLMRQEEV
jgi:hypothetical protein